MYYIGVVCLFFVFVLPLDAHTAFRMLSEWLLRAKWQNGAVESLPRVDISAFGALLFFLLSSASASLAALFLLIVPSLSLSLCQIHSLYFLFYPPSFSLAVCLGYILSLSLSLLLLFSLESYQAVGLFMASLNMPCHVFKSGAAWDIKLMTPRNLCRHVAAKILAVHSTHAP